MFKDEAPWLKEWVVFHHHVLGAEHFYLYNNDSSDNYREVLQPFIDKGIVELIEWNSDEESRAIRGLYDWNTKWVPFQLGAYQDCIKKRALGKAKWVAFIDIDEFIVPVHGVASFYDHLRYTEKRNRGTIRLKWRVFGTSNVWDLQPGELLTEKLTYRCQDDHPVNGLQKCIHRPEAIEMCHLHEALRYKEFSGKTAHPTRLMRINHYWSRTEKLCLEKRKENKVDNPAYFDTFNEIKDDSMAQYLPDLQRAMLMYSD